MVGDTPDLQLPYARPHGVPAEFETAAAPGSTERQPVFPNVAAVCTATNDENTEEAYIASHDSRRAGSCPPQRIHQDTVTASRRR